MNTSKYPVVFLIGGMMLKGLLVLLASFIRSDALVVLLTTYDPLALAFANWGSSLFFDPRRIAPGPGKARIFEMLLVIGFGIECLLVGFVFRWFRRRRSPAAPVPLPIVFGAFGFPALASSVSANATAKPLGIDAASVLGYDLGTAPDLRVRLTSAQFEADTSTRRPRNHDAYGWTRRSRNIIPSGRTDFTSKERDGETGLDYFGARYMASAQGRFISPDEWQGGAVDPVTGKQVQQPGPLPYADITYPQSLNKYAYVMNNPLRYTDPDGHCVGDLCVGEGAAGYAIGAAAAGATAAYLASPQGQESVRATVSLLEMAAVAIGDIVFQQDKGRDAVPVPNAAPRPRAEKLRKESEKFHGKPWPIDPATGKPQDADHDIPRAEGGHDGPTNITPRPKKEHRERHKEKGDFVRWGKRAKPNSAPRPAPEPPRPVRPPNKEKD